MEDGWLTPGVWSSRSRSERSSKDAPALDAPRAKLIALACTRPPETEQGLRRERWTYRELGDAVGLSESHAHRILAAAEIRPHLTEYWVVSELGPDFDAQAAEVCGLYLDPPENAIVVSIDEKTGVQAKGRAPTAPQRPPSPPGATTSTCATEPRTSSRRFRCIPARSRGWPPRRATALTSSPSSTASRTRFPPDKSVVGILDNLSTKHASWLNQVEIFFSILQRRLIKHGIFDSEDDLGTQMLPSSSTTTSQPGRLSGPTPARCSLYRAGTCGMNH